MPESQERLDECEKLERSQSVWRLKDPDQRVRGAREEDQEERGDSSGTESEREGTDAAVPSKLRSELRTQTPRKRHQRVTRKRGSRVVKMSRKCDDWAVQ